MTRTGSRHGFAMGAAGLMVLLAGCTPERQPSAPQLDVVDNTPGYGVMVCKIGPIGTYTFNVSASGGSGWSYPNGTTFSIDVTQAYGDLTEFCKQAWAPSSDLSAPAVDVTVGEAVPTGMQVDSMVVYRDQAFPYYGVTQVTVPAGATYSTSYYVKVFNSPQLVCTDQTATNYGGPLPCEYLPPCPAGSFTYSVLTSSGDLFIKYDQFPAPNDNSYGVNAVGWPRGHKFSDLVGSDHAGIQLVDGNGTVRLSFNVDYLTASSSAPSGYASLGVTGGDGKMLVGTADGISATTSLANNLNNINIPGLFNAAHVQQFGSVNLLMDSPPTDAAHTTYVISDATLVGWDFHDTYFVTISAAKLASLGFDPGTWTVEPNLSQLHNSPAKACPSTSGSELDVTKAEVKDKQVKLTILNSGSSDAFLTELALTWPSVTNGKLMQVKRDGDVIYDKPDIAGGTADLTTAQLVADQNKRKWEKGKSHVLILVFEKNADKTLSDYTGTATFGTVALTILPK